MAEIPVYKERRMTAIDPGSGELSSYKINESYVGILRLSPNSSVTLLEKDTHVGVTEDTSDYIIYEDTVADILDKQLIKVSTSDGVLLDLRLGTDTVEYDNLYVLGAVKAKSLVVYGGLTMNGIEIPQIYNSDDTASNGSPVLSAPITKNNISDAYILVNTASDGEEPVFEYKNARTFIHSIINDTLQNLSSLPTGSIHWVPVSFEQYNALLATNQHNSSREGTDTLIRDFLLCDGSTYNNIDYPELAKILHGEKVTRWVKDGDYMVPEEVTSGDNYTFTVPDLRSMFIEYLIPSIDMAKEPKNQPGYWEIDSCKHQELVIADKTDKHYHYIVLDSSGRKQSNTIVPGVELGSERPLAKYGSMRPNGIQYSGANTTKGCDTRNCRCDGCWDFYQDGVQNEIVSSIYPPKDLSDKCRISSSTCGYILSANYQTSPSIKHGLSSNAIYKGSLRPVYDKLNYTADNATMGLNKEVHRKQRDVYKKTKSYVSYKDSNRMDIIGKENTPEFFACLPLIKI